MFMAFTTIINCSRRLACCGQVLISNQYVSLFYELNLYEDKVQTTTTIIGARVARCSSANPGVFLSCVTDTSRKQLNFDFYYRKLNGTE